MEEQKRKELLHYYSSVQNPKEQENIISMLREIQDLDGYISEVMIKEICECLDIKENFLICLIRRFPSLKILPYQHTVTVCVGPRCQRKNADQILKAVREVLKPDENGVSEDQIFYLRVQNCLKHCAVGPSFLVDDVLYSRVNPKNVKTIFDQIKIKETSHWNPKEIG